jgi:hypothetical protein
VAVDESGMGSSGLRTGSASALGRSDGAALLEGTSGVTGVLPLGISGTVVVSSGKGLDCDPGWGGFGGVFCWSDGLLFGGADEDGWAGDWAVPGDPQQARRQPELQWNRFHLDADRLFNGTIRLIGR